MSACPVCGGREVGLFWEAADVPVFCNVLCATRAEAERVPRGDIRLAYCRGCGFINNRAFDPRRMTYSVSYENSLHFSPCFREYADALARRLVERYDLHGKDVLEIACGQGEFLKTLCALGDNRGVGFDPSYVPKESTAPGTERVSFVQDYYTQRYADRRADFICCRHALEHFADPRAFLRMVRANVGSFPAIVFFEVPNALYTLREMGIWDLIYEHCNYFVSAALRRCFEEAGFEVLALGEEYGGQFLTIEARPAAVPPAPAKGDELATVTADVDAFAARYLAKVEAWRAKLAEMRRGHRHAVVWGSGSKGVTFLNLLNARDCIDYVVDVNPRKQGKHVAGAGQRIVAPEALTAYRPDCVIVMNPLYAEEIRRALAGLGLHVELVLA